ncbi:MAG: hypothetical protein KatS3mg110_2831 [Pirellulaceae bacterium]|nr:MAG: hypothetical protein KatS3mg110_2831 [Pirellulaceae bacterium]
MARPRRCDVFSNGELIRLVCGSTCVRQEGLIRRDPSRVDERIDRPLFLFEKVVHYASVFGLVVYSCTILPEAILISLQLRPDWVESWSNEEVLQRAWKGLRNLVKEYCKEHGIECRWKRNPPAVLLEDQKFQKEMRERLSSVSLFMKLIKQTSAFHFNREDGVRGCFWSERFSGTPEKSPADSVTMNMLIDAHPVAVRMVPVLEQPHHGSGWCRLVYAIQVCGVEVTEETLADTPQLSDEVRASLGRAFRLLREGMQRVVDGDIDDGELTEEADLSDETTAEPSAVEQTEAPAAGGQASGNSETSFDEATALGAPNEETLAASPSGQVPSRSGGGQARAELRGSRNKRKTSRGAAGRQEAQRDERRKFPVPPIKLGPVDCRRYSGEMGAGVSWQHALGIGPIDEVEWAELVRLVGTTWCAWRQIKPEDQDVVFDKKRYDEWRQGQRQFRMGALDEQQLQRARQKLIEWLTECARVGRVPGLLAEEDRARWADRLLAARQTPEELADEVAELLGVSEERMAELRGALARVKLTISRIVEAGELWRVDLVRGAQELLGLREWVARRRAMLRAQAEGSSAEADARPPPDTS